jgi:zinc protease
MLPNGVQAAPTATAEAASQPLVIANGSGPLPRQANLHNGLKVVLVEDHSYPVVSCHMWYRVGARNETPGLTGISHILEHLLFQNVGSYRKGEMGAVVVRNGGQFNGFTSDDFIAFYETLHPSKLDLALKMEAARMRSAAFQEADLKEEVARVKQELEAEAKDQTTLLNKEVRATAFQQHPYRNPTSGVRVDIDNLSVEEVRSFYDRFFHPDNATLVIVGDIKPNFAMSMVSKHFGPIPKSARLIPPVRVVEPQQKAERRVLMRYPGKKDVAQIAYHAPSFSDPDAPAVVIFEKLLNAQLNGRLKTKLVDTKVCSSARSAFELKKDPGLFFVNMTAASGTPVQKVVEAWDGLIGQLKAAPVSDSELRRAKNLAEFAFLSERDGPYRAGFNLGYCDALQSWHACYTIPEKMHSVTAADLQRIAKKYFAAETRVVGLLTSAANAPQSPPAKPAGAGGSPGKPPQQKTPSANGHEKRRTATDITRNFPLYAYKSDDDGLPKLAQVPSTPAANPGSQTAPLNGALPLPATATIPGPPPGVAPGATDRGSAANVTGSGASPSRTGDAAASSPPATSVTKPTSTTATAATSAPSASVAPSASAAPSASVAPPASAATPAPPTPAVTATPAAASTTSATPAGAAAPSGSSTGITAPNRLLPVTNGSLNRMQVPLNSTLPVAPAAHAATKPHTAPASTPVESFTIPTPSKRVLKNGATLIVYESRLSPIIQIEGAIAAGDAYEPSAKRGLSALTAICLDNGSDKFSRISRQSWEEDLGMPPEAMLKFEPGRENIRFHARFLSRDLSSQFTQIANILKEPATEDDDIERYKQEFANLVKHGEDFLSTKVERALLRSALAPNSACYPVDPSERVRSAANLKSQDVKDFLTQNIVPEATTFVVAGDIDPETAARALEKALEGWGHGGGKPKATANVELNSRRIIKSTLPLRDKSKSLVCLGRLLATSKSARDYSQLLVADCALTKHPIFARLIQRLNDDPGLSASLSEEDIQSRFLPISRYVAWSLNLAVEPNAVPQTVSSIQNELAKFVRSGLSAEELAEVKRYLLNALPVREMANTTEAAKTSLDASLQGAPADYVTTLLSDIRATTTDSINKYIRTDFKPEQASLVVAGPRQAIRDLRGSTGVNQSTEP